MTSCILCARRAVDLAMYDFQYDAGYPLPALCEDHTREHFFGEKVVKVGEGIPSWWCAPRKRVPMYA